MRFLNHTNGKSFELLDSVKVQIMEVSDDVYLELSSDKDAHQHYLRVQRKSKNSNGGKRRIMVDAKAKHKNSGHKNNSKSRKKR
jgi:hypothetical protein